MFKRILVPIDFSENARGALELAVRLAAEQGAELTVLNVVMSPHLYTSELGMTEVGPLFMQVADELRAASARTLKEWTADVIPEAMAVSYVVRQGYPPEEIIQAALDGRCDVVVMGAHGRTGLRGAFLGSVTNRVLRNCPVPVLVTR